jgi:hypothetical protein
MSASCATTADRQPQHHGHGRLPTAPKGRVADTAPIARGSWPGRWGSSACPARRCPRWPRAWTPQSSSSVPGHWMPGRTVRACRRVDDQGPRGWAQRDRARAERGRRERRPASGDPRLRRHLGRRRRPGWLAFFGSLGARGLSGVAARACRRWAGAGERGFANAESGVVGTRDASQPA